MPLNVAQTLNVWYHNLMNVSNEIFGCYVIRFFSSKNVSTFSFCVNMSIMISSQCQVFKEWEDVNMVELSRQIQKQIQKNS